MSYGGQEQRVALSDESCSRDLLGLHRPNNSQWSVGRYDAREAQACLRELLREFLFAALLPGRQGQHFDVDPLRKMRIVDSGLLFSTTQHCLCAVLYSL